MELWWSKLSGFESMYWIIAIPATILLAFQLILVFVGAGMHHDVSHGTDHGFEEPHFQLISFRGLVAFFAMLGWSGIALVNMHVPWWVCLLVSMFCGTIMMILLAFMYWGILHLQSSGTIDYSGLTGSKGVVYLPITKNSGKIVVNKGDRKIELDAKCEEDLPTNTSITIKHMDGTKAVVERS